MDLIIVVLSMRKAGSTQLQVEGKFAAFQNLLKQLKYLRGN
jgi:hypothetical protein